MTRETPLVAVIDSGWDRSIRDGAIVPGIGAVDPTDDFAIEWSNDDQDRLGHGTAISDVILQVAPRTRILPIRIFGSRLETAPEILVAAIEWATLRGVQVMNLSLGTHRRDIAARLYRACEAARQAGIVVVSAAGSGPEYALPATFEPVIGVTASYLNVSDRFAVEYRANHQVECIAAGRQMARGRGGIRQYFRGSSIAAAVVTGRIAKFLENIPNSSLESVRIMLERESEQTTSNAC